MQDIEGHEGYTKLNGRYRSLLQLTLNFYSSAMSQATTELSDDFGLVFVCWLQVAALSMQIQDAVKAKDSEREARH